MYYCLPYFLLIFIIKEAGSTHEIRNKPSRIFSFFYFQKGIPLPTQNTPLVPLITEGCLLEHLEKENREETGKTAARTRRMRRRLVLE